MIDLSSSIDMATATHPGMVRSHNEDCIAVDPQIGLAVLADGMGGYNAGEVASGIAVAMITAEMKKAIAKVNPQEFDLAAAEKMLAEHAVKANGAIYHASQTQAQYSGMGTTLVVALWHDNHMSVAHIGDSRLYRLREDVLEQVTRDHSLLQEQIDSGLISKEQARHAQNKNLVTRAVGIDPQVEPEVHTYEALPGDVYLICSDGLSDMVTAHARIIESQSPACRRTAGAAGQRQWRSGQCVGHSGSRAEGILRGERFDRKNEVLV